MKSLLVCLLLSISAAARADTTEDYLAARDRAIAAANRANAPLSEKQEDRARAKLEQRLAEVIGPWKADGFKQPGRINLVTLVREMEFGQLDGLVYASTDEKTSVIVTTPSLLQSWLKAHEHWWSGDGNVPQQMESAFQNESFYTQALSTDASVALFAAVPVTRPPGASFVGVQLDIRRQDISPEMPNEILAAVIRDGRVFVASQPVATALVDLPECAEIWRRADAASEAAWAAYRAAGAKDETQSNAAEKLAVDGDRDHLRCVGAHLTALAGFEALKAQAQALVERLK